jgi:hypothetical protein
LPSDSLMSLVLRNSIVLTIFMLLKSSLLIPWDRIDFSNSFQNGDTVVLVWTMYCAHSALNAGKEFSVDGMSYIRFDPKSGKAVYHRDYFDLGEMIYENVPVLKTLIGFIKSRAANK